MLFQQGVVVEPLCLSGRIRIQGELWRAVTFTGERIDQGERVEVIAREGLTLKVDRAQSDSEGPASDASRRAGG
jgi:membrane-bound serine protease (ClpP class)